MKQWTVGYVNYHSSYYLSYQMRGLFKYNDPDFKVIIVNNCEDDLSWLRDKYGVEIVENYPTKHKHGSQQHGEGLNIIHSMCDTPRLFVQDPDFFWIRKNYLNRLAELLDQGNVAAGVHFHCRIVTGNRRFPAACCCAYNAASLEPGDFDAFQDPAELAQSKDVGWKIRWRYSKHPFHSFPYTVMDETWPDWKKICDMGTISAKTENKVICIYTDEGQPIGFHALHGCWLKPVVKAGKPNPPLKWVEARKAHAAYFMSLLDGDKQEPLIL